MAAAAEAAAAARRAEHRLRPPRRHGRRVEARRRASYDIVDKVRFERDKRALVRVLLKEKKFEEEIRVFPRIRIPTRLERVHDDKIIKEWSSEPLSGGDERLEISLLDCYLIAT